jgi:DNA repair protein RecO (recombination protein O)
MQATRTTRVYRTDGVVLKGFDYGEADRLLTLFTPHHGKLRAVAKGTRRTKSRMSGHLDLFTRSSLLVARGRQLDIITQAETLEAFRGVRGDLVRSTCCHYVAELIDGFSQENLANQPLYDLTVRTLRRLETAPDLDLVLRAFEVALLSLTGFRPQLFRCLHCDAPLQPQANRFSVRLGGALCPECTAADTSALPVSVAALKMMRNLQANEDSMLQVRDLPAQVHREVETRLQDYIIYRLEAKPRSLTFLERLRAEQVMPGGPT